MVVDWLYCFIDHVLWHSAFSLVVLHKNFSVTFYYTKLVNLIKIWIFIEEGCVLECLTSLALIGLIVRINS